MLREQRLLAQDEELRALRSQSDQRLAVLTDYWSLEIFATSIYNTTSYIYSANRK